MEINNLHLEKQLEKILKPSIVWYTKIKKFQFNDIYLDELETSYFASEIEIFKNFLYFFKAENLINEKSIENIKLLFQKRLKVLKNDIGIFKKKKFIINGIYCLSTDDKAPKINNNVNSSTYLQNPDYNDILQFKFHYHISNSISQSKLNDLLKDKENGEFIIQNIKLQVILQLHYESINNFVEFLNSILILNENFVLTDFKPYFAPESKTDIFSKIDKKKCVLNMKNYDVVNFFYLMHIYNYMFIDKRSKTDRKRVDLQHFFEENFMYLDKNGNPQNIVRFQSQLSKINDTVFEDNKRRFIKQLRENLEDYESNKVPNLLSKIKK